MKVDNSESLIPSAAFYIYVRVHDAGLVRHWRTHNASDPPSGLQSDNEVVYSLLGGTGPLNFKIKWYMSAAYWWWQGILSSVTQRVQFQSYRGCQGPTSLETRLHTGNKVSDLVLHPSMCPWPTHLHTVV